MNREQFYFRIIKNAWNSSGAGSEWMVRSQGRKGKSRSHSKPVENEGESPQRNDPSRRRSREGKWKERHPSERKGQKEEYKRNEIFLSGTWKWIDSSPCANISVRNESSIVAFSYEAAEEDEVPEACRIARMAKVEGNYAIQRHCSSKGCNFGATEESVLVNFRSTVANALHGELWLILNRCFSSVWSTLAFITDWNCFCHFIDDFIRVVLLIRSIRSLLLKGDFVEAKEKYESKKWIKKSLSWITNEVSLINETIK